MTPGTAQQPIVGSSQIEFDGVYFDGRSSKANAVRVRFDGGQLHLRGDASLDAPLRHCTVDPPLGKTRRVIHLPGGGRLETGDLERIAALEERTGLNRGMTLVDRLEGRWPFVLASFAGLAVAIVAFMLYGLPWAARVAAFATPPAVLNGLSEQTLKALDDAYLEPSTLSRDRQSQLLEVFLNITRKIGGPYRYKLEFRAGGTLGPNAFALPSGTVVMTDALVELAESDLEIEGVLAHEVGHVTGRHSLRQLYQGLGVVAVGSVLLGDFTSVLNIASSLPAIFVQNGYSRDAEREADATAAGYLLDTNRSPKALGDMLRRLERQRTGGTLPALFSTHPGTDERIRNLERFARDGKPPGR